MHHDRPQPPRYCVDPWLPSKGELQSCPPRHSRWMQRATADHKVQPLELRWGRARGPCLPIASSVSPRIRGPTRWSERELYQRHDHLSVGRKRQAADDAEGRGFRDRGQQQGQGMHYYIDCFGYLVRSHIVGPFCGELKGY